MSHCLYSKGIYRVIQLRDKSFLIINTEKKFENGHTHTYNYDISKIIVYACYEGKFPKRLTNLYKNKRVLKSIIRICSNKYIKKFKKMLEDLEKEEEIDT